MGRAGTAALLGCLTLAITACLPGQACTLIGAVQGISITIDGTPAASSIESLTLTTCVEDDCTDTEVHLSEPGVVPAEVQGLASVELPEEEDVQVEATLVALNGRTSTYLTTIRPEMVYPNGRRCGGGATQASLILDDRGLRQD